MAVGDRGGLPTSLKRLSDKAKPANNGTYRSLAERFKISEEEINELISFSRLTALYYMNKLPNSRVSKELKDNMLNKASPSVRTAFNLTPKNFLSGVNESTKIYKLV